MEEFKGDRRTKEYKNWLAKDQNQKSNLYIGDKIAKVTERTGIDKVVKFVFGEDCGCEERQEKVNNYVSKLFGRRHIKSLTQEEYEYILSTKILRKLNADQQHTMRTIHERVFNIRQVSGCSSCSFASKIWLPLLKLVEAYD